MKRRKDKTLEDKHPQGVRYATGEVWRAITNSPRKNEEAGPKWKQCSVVDVSGGELKSLLMKVKEESEKVDSKLNFQKTTIMASGPIISWQIDGETTETVRDFWGAPKSLQMITAALKSKDTWSMEEKLYQPRQHIEKQIHCWQRSV